MNRTLLGVLAALFAVVMVGCSDTSETTAPNENGVGIESSKQGASVQGTTVEKKVSNFNFTRSIECTGDRIRFRGTQTTWRTTRLRGDGRYEEKRKILVKATGVDRDDNKFEMISRRTDTDWRLVPEDCPYGSTESVTTLFTTPGGKNNQEFTESFEVTNYCDGSFDVEIKEPEIKCK